MKKRYLIGSAITFASVSAVAVSVFCVYGMSRAFPDTSATPAQAYATLFDQQMPSSTTDAECHGAFWMDYNFAIRFHNADLNENQLLNSGYRTTNWSSLKELFDAPPYHVDFEGRWVPNELPNMACYTRVIESSDCLEEHSLVIDWNHNLAYGVGEGNVK